MKNDEIRFFRTCWRCRNSRRISICDIIHIVSEFIHYKRCLYLLRKWSDIGFYDYGVNIAFGWFYTDKLPERYAALVSDMTLDGGAEDA